MAEKLTNEFTVNRPIEEAWPIVTDVEKIAPCMPGAELKEIEGDTYRGVVKVKLGPIATQFKGEASFSSLDDDGHTAVLQAAGRDTQGRGNASAEITAVAESLSPTSTRFTVTTDLHITGKVAQFGRGIMGEVSAKLMEEFATNLNTMLDEDEPAAAEAVAEEQAPAAPAVEPAAADTADLTDDAGPTVRKIEGPATEPIDLMEVGGSSIVKRAIPPLVILLIVILLLRRRRG